MLPIGPGDNGKADIFVYPNLTENPTGDFRTDIRSAIGSEENYPLYAVLLYSNMDSDLVKYVRVQGYTLHKLSGEDCIVYSLENPIESKDYEKYRDYWRKKIGDHDFAFKFSKEWLNHLPLELDDAFDIASRYGIPKDKLPVILLLEDLNSSDYIWDPIKLDEGEDKYSNYFKSLFADIGAIKNEKKSDKLKALKKLRNNKEIDMFMSTFEPLGSLKRKLVEVPI